MRKFSHQILSIYVDVCIVLLCLCIGMYRVGDEMKWNDGILVICERTEKSMVHHSAAAATKSAEFSSW